MARVLTVGDLHLPAVRKGYLEFCQDLYYAWDCDTVVFIGDIIDWQAISFHAAHPMCPGPLDEYQLAKQHVAIWAKAFPKAFVCIGNHDERPSRLAKTVNIPDFMLRPYSELWDTPNWIWDFRFIIDEVNYRHGTGIGGIHPAWNAMNKIHQSVVMGHLHARMGIKYSMNSKMRIFGLDCGCGIDERAFNFAYGRDTIDRPALSAGVIIDGVGYVEPMLVGKGEKYWDGNFK